MLPIGTHRAVGPVCVQKFQSGKWPIWVGDADRRRGPTQIEKCAAAAGGSANSECQCRRVVDVLQRVGDGGETILYGEGIFVKYRGINGIGRIIRDWWDKWIWGIEGN